MPLDPIASATELATAKQAPVSRTVAGLLDALEATLALYVATHLAHVNVEPGAGALELHSELERQYRELVEHFDRLAERARALGAKVTLGVGANLDTETVPELAGAIRAHRLALAGRLIALRETAAAAGDHATAALLDELTLEHMRRTWILQLAGAPADPPAPSIPPPPSLV